jgi:hypothetical protein
MTMSSQNATDPLEFVRNMWGNIGFSLPGIVTPTLDVGELDQRITDMRAVEGWLKMNLNMLQMTIQGLDVQRAALAAVNAISQQAQANSESGAANPFVNAMWPWEIMAAATATTPAEPGAPAADAPAAAPSGEGKARSSAERRKSSGSANK